MNDYQRKEWERVKREATTKEDWRDLYEMIEAVKIRRIERHARSSSVRDRIHEAFTAGFDGRGTA